MMRVTIIGFSFVLSCTTVVSLTVGNPIDDVGSIMKNSPVAIVPDMEAINEATEVCNSRQAHQLCSIDLSPYAGDQRYGADASASIV